MIYAVNKQTKEHRAFDGLPSISESWDIIQADDNGWIEWHGGECPLPSGAPVEIKHRCGKTYEEPCGSYRSKGWSHIGLDSDIIAYRPILEPQAPKWDGEGLPPVGMMCEYRHDKEWVEAEVLAHRNYCAIVWTEDGAYFSCVSRKFRPIRTDREKWIDDALDAIKQDYSHHSISTTSPQDYVENAVVQLYNAIQNGDISAPKPKDERQEWGVDDLAECVTKGNADLTLGKIYRVLGVDDKGNPRIKADNGVVSTWNSRAFRRA